MNEPLYELDVDFWEKIKVPYAQQLATIRDNCEMVLSSNKFEIMSYNMYRMFLM